MKTLTAKQLSFLLKCTVDEAKRMMANAWEKEQGIEIKFTGARMDIRDSAGNKSDYNEDDYPSQMDIEMLSRNLNLPYLPDAVTEVHKRYLIRSATRGYILSYPESLIKRKIADAGSIEKVLYKLRISIPSPLNTMLAKELIDEIRIEWTKRYSKYPFVEIAI